MSLLTAEERSFLLERSSFFEGLPRNLCLELIAIANVVTYPQHTFISRIGEQMDDVLIVISGLIRVNACSSTGNRITFLLAKAGEPYNLLSPFIKSPRILEAQAVEKTRCLWFKGSDFREFVESHPPLAAKLFQLIGIALDSANSRILDLMEKKVEERIKRVLSTLHAKFGSPLLFTSREIAEIAGTTTESALRSMAQLRKMNIIETERGKIWIKDPESLKDVEFGIMLI